MADAAMREAEEEIGKVRLEALGEVRWEIEEGGETGLEIPDLGVLSQDDGEDDGQRGGGGSGA